VIVPAWVPLATAATAPAPIVSEPPFKTSIELFPTPFKRSEPDCNVPTVPNPPSVVNPPSTHPITPLPLTELNPPLTVPATKEPAVTVPPKMSDVSNPTTATVPELIPPLTVA
jgi:hypothetical protein